MNTSDPFFCRLAGVLQKVEYRGWTFLINQDALGLYNIQVAFQAPDNTNMGKSPPTVQKGRKWRVSAHMTDSELVQTLFLAVKTAEEHEMRERFLYRNVAIFGPHFHPDALYEMAFSVPFDKRQD